MIVYIVINYNYSQTGVVKVFADKEKAEAFAKEQNEKDKDPVKGFFVEEYLVEE
jgi:hypothetical protein